MANISQNLQLVNDPRELFTKHLRLWIRETDTGRIMEQDVPLTSIGFTNFFRCLIFEFFIFTNTDVLKIKDETSYMPDKKMICIQ